MQCGLLDDLLESEREFIAVRLCTTHQATVPTRLPCAACTQEVDSLVDTARAEVTRENADILIAMWQRMESGHPHKDGIRHASTILYGLAHITAGEADA